MFYGFFLMAVVIMPYLTHHIFENRLKDIKIRIYWVTNSSLMKTWESLETLLYREESVKIQEISRMSFLLERVRNFSSKIFDFIKKIGWLRILFFDIFIHFRSDRK